MKLGNIDINTIKLGTSDVTKIMLGDLLIWEKV